MITKMYVGNLSFESTEHDLRDLFGSHGAVTDVFMPTDRDTQRPRGFAFVTMDSADSMKAAISALDGKEYQGRSLTVNEARPPGSGGANGGGGGGGGGYRGANGGSGGGKPSYNRSR